MSGCVYVWVGVCVGFVMFVFVCGFCNVWVCVCVGVCMCGFCNVWVCVRVLVICLLVFIVLCIVSFMLIYS